MRPVTEVPDENRVVTGRYRLLAPLGQGGMGVVWRARDEVLGREVAVKEVRAPSGLGGSDQQRLYQRLEREAWAAARISHRNVVTVYDVATEDGRPWIVMELVRGLSLSDVLDAEGSLTPQRAAHIGAEVLAALRAAHEAGVLHRDVKPGNVLIGNDGRVVLTDFGIAMVEGTSALTMTGELIGSPEFLAPERALGRAAGPESDLWSLGVLLYAAVEGNSPFRLDTPLSTLRAVVDEELPPPTRSGALRPVLEGLLRKDPAERMSGAEADRMLRIVAAGGTAAVTGGVYGSPTVTGSTPYRPTPTPTPPPRPVPVPVPSAGSGSGAYGPAGGQTATTTSGEQPRRGVAALALGIAVLLLAVAGLVYVLTRKDDPGATAGTAGQNGSGGTDSSTGSSGGTGTTTEGNDGTGSGSGSTGSSDAGGTGSTTDGTTGGKTTPPPRQTVRVSVHAVRDSYSGPCPAPEGEAPAFSATITIDRSPEKVEYQWTTSSGETSGGDWKTLDFPTGTTNRQVDHIELTHRAGGTWQDSVLLKVRSPRSVTSAPAAFSVTCDKATPTPTGGVTSPPVSTSPVEPYAIGPRTVRPWRS
ncbi:serine/threonine protein kinase [Streptomyces sp. NBC_00237]|uniref:serine/threonine-protein kinase n=1 Tax=Streptomyces sp. NBC_00237 TaxID=2975687 RepID=UPI0022544AB0|nr:serine/threonine-protein kinase [Streptomyces sp. NBC_00237]MCX5202206.1 serine/threonine protein kinase [Streptomyces sp. NBC_00237]